jgi:hypothetical protein
MATCTRCGHSSDHHRLDDSKNVGPVESAAKFRCVVTRDGRTHPTYVDVRPRPRGAGWDHLPPPSPPSADYCECPDFENLPTGSG